MVPFPPSIHHYVYYDCIPFLPLKETYGFLLNLPFNINLRFRLFCFAYTFPLI